MNRRDEVEALNFKEVQGIEYEGTLEEIPIRFWETIYEEDLIGSRHIMLWRWISVSRVL
jgi:hypothetical protein